MHGLLAALGIPTNDKRSIVCKRSAVVQQLEILRKTYEDAEDKGVFHMTLDIEVGKITLSIEGHQEVFERLPYGLEPGTAGFDEAMRSAFGT